MAPWFRALSEEPDLQVHVIYFREPDPREQGVGFGIDFAWDVPLRKGHESTVLGFSKRWRSAGALLVALVRVLKQVKPDVVLVTGWNEPGLIAAYPVMWLMGLPTIVRSEANLKRHYPWWTVAFHRALLSTASAAVAIGRSNSDFYLSRGVPPARIFRGCYFVDSALMRGMAEKHAPDRAPLRAALGFFDDDVVFCFVGKHAPYKRPLMLVEAAARLRAQGLPVKLLIAGAGELTAALEQRANQTEVPARFIGFLNQTELWRAYTPSDVLVLPSSELETWGLVANEAMHFGLPVIVSDKVGCGPDLVRDGETGYTFSHDADGLAEAMEKLVRQGESRRCMGDRARRLVEAEYSMPVATAGLKEATRSICSPMG
jgi:glycosyltransferase involved in cell wall biosynthesis